MNKQNTPAFNACMTLLAFILFIMAVGSATAGQGGAFVLLLLASVGVALTINHQALLPEWELDIVESHPALDEPWSGLSSTVGAEQLAWDIDHTPVELYECIGSPESYTGLDCFGNLIKVENGVVCGCIQAAHLDNPLAA